MPNIPAQQSSNMQDYLEAIIVLRGESEAVKVTQISKALGVRNSSVTAAMAKLSRAGLVEHKRYGHVELTAEGEEIARDVYQRHKTLRHFLTRILDVEPQVADGDACRMEHVLSESTMERLEKFLEFVLNCPRGEPEWLNGFNYYLEHGERDQESLARCQREAS
ncbi:MAG: metal-dependent transcriptional regulator [Dehalococcoidia bacterium]